VSSSVAAGQVSAPATSVPPRTGRLVARNALWTLLAQLMGMPMSVLLSAVLARGLGPEEFGTLYLATTLIGFAAVLGEVGQAGALPAAVARDHDAAGALVGAAVALRLFVGVGAHAVLVVVALCLGYPAAVKWSLAILTVQTFLGHVGSSATGMARGFERGALVARNTMIGQVLNAAAVIPTVLLGGKLQAVLLAQLGGAVCMTVIDWRLVKALGVRVEAATVARVKRLGREGAGFLLLSLILVLQPNVDAISLSKLAPEAVIGWHAAARRLMGMLVFPASAVTVSLYPSLCRLRVEAPEDMRATVRSSLELVAFLVVPAALGCVFYPDLGIRIFSRTSFGPAETNVQLLAPFVLLVYFSMIIGTYITSLGRQMAWAAAQLACVLVSVVANPLLVPYFQRTRGNGGLGVCISTVVSEALMVAAGSWLAPRGLLDRKLLKSFGCALAGAAVMALVAWRSRAPLGPWFSAAAAVVAYVATLRLTGGLGDEHLGFLRDLLRRRRA